MPHSVWFFSKFSIILHSVDHANKHRFIGFDEHISVPSNFDN